MKLREASHRNVCVKGCSAKSCLVKLDLPFVHRLVQTLMNRRLALTTPISGLPLPPQTIANHHQQLLCEVRESTGNIQSLDPMTRTLTVLPWYVVHNRDGHLIVGRRANSLYVAS